MIGTMVTLAVCTVLLLVARWWWSSVVNPVVLGILAWLPALVMVNWPPYFLSPLYIHLNRAISPYVYVALAMGFFSFWAGCALVKALSAPEAFQARPDRLSLNVDIRRLLLLFGIGLAVFAYSYFESGLLDLANLDDQQVAVSRVNLHLGLLSFVMLLMDIASIGFFARFLQTGKWSYVLPVVMTILCYGATLQKSPVVQLLIACLFVAMLHPKAAYHFFWKSTLSRVAVLVLGFSVLAGLAAMNEARGIAVVQITSASSPIAEQIYIYSGASAIMNVSVTLEGYLPSTPPAYGAFLGRPVLWHFMDRDMFVAARYFEGVNSGTYLIYGWADFRWFGFFITPFLTGILVMLFLRMALSGTLVGLMFGVTAMRTVMLSAATDVMFDPTTWIVLGVSFIAYILAKTYRSKAVAHWGQTRLPAPGPRSARPVAPRVQRLG